MSWCNSSKSRLYKWQGRILEILVEEILRKLSNDLIWITEVQPKVTTWAFEKTSWNVKPAQFAMSRQIYFWVVYYTQSQCLIQIIRYWKIRLIIRIWIFRKLFPILNNFGATSRIQIHFFKFSGIMTSLWLGHYSIGAWIGMRTKREKLTNNVVSYQFWWL